MIPAAVLQAFGFRENEARVRPFGTGLINHTWKIEKGDDAWILQRINQQVFRKPFDIAQNLELIGDFLGEKFPGYLFVKPGRTINGDPIFFDKGDEGYYRLMPFVENSHTIDVVVDPAQAFEAARQFGRFTRLLTDFPVNELRITLPHFHDLSLRYRQFEDALIHGNKQRIATANAYVQHLKEQKPIVDIFESIKNNPAFKLRVTHHDTKISNVLFDDNDKGLCVIDLDTVMPGYFISDVGDMMRTYLSPVSEEESDYSKIQLRAEYFEAIAKGYLSEMASILSNEEIQYFVYAGKFLVYMQALRFLTDYINNDVYYGSRYEGQNFVRAGNQVVLLQKLIEKEEQLKEVVRKLVVDS